MKLERGKNATRNMVFGIVQVTYSQLMPFVIRTIIIYLMGIQYAGLNSLFTSILSVLNLAELGVGSAMVFSMYKPIAEDDKVTICALMKLYRTYYRVIGLIILVIGIVITPFIPKLIKGTIPGELNIYVLYFMNLVATVLTYWLYGYKNCLLSAHQRNDIVYKIGIATSTITYILQILVLSIKHDYYYYLAISLFMNAAYNIISAMIVDKLFPQYRAKGKLSKKQVSEINHRVKDLFTLKIGNVVVGYVDTIIISTFLGLKSLAIYQNYYFIISAVFGFVTVVFKSCTAGIGNSIIVETEEKNLNDLKKFTLMISWIGGFCCSCFAGMYQPFMTLWVGKKLLLNYNYVILFCVYFYVLIIDSLLNLYKDAAGVWHKDRFRPLVTALVNLVMNLIMVQFWGLYGIILSTIISMLFVGIPWLYHNLFSVLFHNGSKTYLSQLLMYSLTAVISTTICMIISLNTNIKSSIVSLIFNALIGILIPNCIFFVLYRKKSEFMELVLMIDTLTKGKLKILKRLENG